MRTFSTCRGCGGSLMVYIGEQACNPLNRHDTCTIERPTRRETLSDQLNQLPKDHPDAAYLQSELDELDRQPPRLLDAALLYASWGWPVFPLGPRSKQPAIPRDRGGRGVLDAHCDPDRIKRYWQRHPDHNIGIATGAMFDVIDIDIPEKEGEPDGREWVPKMLASEKIPDAHGVVITASGGFHYYIPASGGGNKAGIAPGVDIRGKGGYVVAAPSVDPRGRWFWSIAASPEIKR